jgi:hypothetical protein
MAYQTTYNERMAPPMPGVVAGQMDNARIVTGIAETAAPGIPFGRAVSQGALSDQGIILGGSLAGLRGVSIRDTTLRGDVSDANRDKYQPTNSAGVLESGDIWIEPGEAVATTDAVYFIAATGVFMKTASGAIGPVPGYRFKTSCGVGGRCILSCDGGKKA